MSSKEREWTGAKDFACRLIITFVISFLCSYVSIIIGCYMGKTFLKMEAVEQGVGKYVCDDNGNTTWVWIKCKD